MSKSVRSLEPNRLWNYFADLNEVPRPSKKEERVIEFAKSFGESLGLETIVDHIGNVIIRKNATKGMESKRPIVMQSHLDMVHQKNADVDFDFLTEGIKMIVDGDWVKADGTTLGADNGIGVASIMAVLASTDIAHPALEALFTIDEETGMTGALELKGGLLEGEILLNLDTEDDDEITIGCAGGIDITSTGAYTVEHIGGDYIFLKLSVKGLSGGHSGMDIHKGLGNANKIMNRILYEASNRFQIKVKSVDGGGLRNAIPRESFSDIAVDLEKTNDFNGFLTELGKVIQLEHASTDPGLQISTREIPAFDDAISSDALNKLIKAIYGCPSGIYRMSPDIDDLVQTSNNLARVLIQDGKYQVLCLCRSSVDSEKTDLMNLIQAVFELVGATVSFDGNYPGWTPRPGTEILKMMENLYTESFDNKVHVAACHAGLECGIIGTNYPHMEMVSFGPNIRGAHSPDEKAQISSVQKFWGFLIDVLKHIPEKNDPQA